uniref:Uncharacterized protein n=1 Tax=Amphimedon queenslandica TaxID=400682 RepID=A0A1X7TLA9_AMPQE
MPRRKQSKSFEALRKARWTARTVYSTAATSISSTRSIIAKDNDRNEEANVTATPKRENQRDSDETMEVTPIHFQKDTDFSFDTPEGRNSGELPNSNSIFLGQVSQMCKFIDQINLTSKCATPLCNVS